MLVLDLGLKLPNKHLFWVVLTCSTSFYTLDPLISLGHVSGSALNLWSRWILPQHSSGICDAQTIFPFDAPVQRERQVNAGFPCKERIQKKNIVDVRSLLNANNFTISICHKNSIRTITTHAFFYLFSSLHLFFHLFLLFFSFFYDDLFL